MNFLFGFFASWFEFVRETGRGLGQNRRTGAEAFHFRVIGCCDQRFSPFPQTR